jgi:hypothetical protein
MIATVRTNVKTGRYVPTIHAIVCLRLSAALKVQQS